MIETTFTCSFEPFNRGPGRFGIGAALQLVADPVGQVHFHLERVVLLPSTGPHRWVEDLLILPE